MDYIILGLLFLSQRTLYQLRERIHQGLNLMYSSSLGSIQAALKKLLQGEYIGYTETVEKGKYKKVYCITEKGKQAFLGWINGPLEPQGVRCPGLVKVYFMGFSDRESREARLEEHLACLKEQYCALEILCQEAKNVAVPEDHRDILTFQLQSALYGRDLYKFNINWYENLLRKMKDGEI